MRFLVDEYTGPGVGRWLRSRGHEVFSVYDEAPGMADAALLQKAVAEGWLLVTNDRDFGELVYRDGRPHHGVILMRLGDERTRNKLAVLDALLLRYADRLEGQFVVVTETQVRFARRQS